MKCIGPRGEGCQLVDFDLRRSCMGFIKKAYWSRSKHVKAHRSKKEKQQMSLFEQFITEGNEKANELANDGAMMDGGEMAKMRTSTVQQKREDVHAALQCAASFNCLVEEWQACKELWAKPKEKCTSVDRQVEAKNHRTEGRAAASKDRCMRCGRSSNKMKMPRTCEGPRGLEKDFQHKLKCGKSAFGRARHGKNSGPE